MTIIRAFAHATNYTSGHETEGGSFYPLDYPDWHIEADNRLSWMLGELGQHFPDARWVHLLRDREGMARSFEARPDWPGASIKGFGAGILGRGDLFHEERYEAAGRMWDAANANITEFLTTRDHRVVWLHDLTRDFPGLWEWVGCQGDLAAAVETTRIRHNAGPGGATIHP